MTDISSGFQDPGDNKDADRDDIPMTQVDDDEVARHRTTTDDAPEGQGSGIGLGPPSAYRRSRDRQERSAGSVL